MPSAFITKQSAPAAITSTTLYTVPAATKTCIQRIIVCNRSNVPVTFRISVHLAGAGDGNEQYTTYDETINSNANVSKCKGITINATDVIKVYAETADLTFNLYGEEIS